MEAEIGVIWPPAYKAKECQQAPEAGGQGGFSLKAWGEGETMTLPCQHLDFKLLATRTVR